MYNRFSRSRTQPFYTVYTFRVMCVWILCTQYIVHCVQYSKKFSVFPVASLLFNVSFLSPYERPL